MRFLLSLGMEKAPALKKGRTPVTMDKIHDGIHGMLIVSMKIYHPFNFA
jgi:hypothetical protein